ncbi:MAG: GNAT family N-acetyltransferase [Candidatus Cloacimonetes bacterium]|jgi:GNAT superfamily N-acetyltransferase|nr:GNAT family N-acetyltransferase [Candidatus Cloacimonadota bacterium]MDD2211230.1 GNAT family N-acetyltransferase [Candidatus Cloacimonadota bacterium]MDD4232420.1 GNAT family N-acetyltransferase [Candidatus Cloacimonadota bacterium]MDD4687978.1 GNAT family N-acetyltransferase [Candidatus Cloacimonadota bacterium]MDY0299889.1 GNAT family N-acetyltransferase [Candidatus Cloacimonadaceae bacterium]
MTIRRAKQEDIEAIAACHIQSWRETYPGIMPQEKLEAMNITASMRNWQYTLDQEQVFLVAEASGTICGFAAGGDNRSNQDCETGIGDSCSAELGALYLIQKFQGLGIGRALFECFCKEVLALGHQNMVVWVAQQNVSCGFYAHMGGELVDKKMLKVINTSVPVIAYRYSSEILQQHAIHVKPKG